MVTRSSCLMCKISVGRRGGGGKEGGRGQRSGALPWEHTPTDPSPAPGGSPSWAPTAVHPVDPERLCTGGRVARENHRLPFLDLNRFHCLLWPLGGTWKGQRGWPHGVSSLFLVKAGQRERRRATRGRRLVRQHMREAEDSGSSLGSRPRPAQCADERMGRRPDGHEGLTLYNSQLPPGGRDEGGWGKAEVQRWGEGSRGGMLESQPLPSS